MIEVIVSSEVITVRVGGASKWHFFPVDYSSQCLRRTAICCSGEGFWENTIVLWFPSVRSYRGASWGLCAGFAKISRIRSASRQISGLIRRKEKDSSRIPYLVTTAGLR